jgi:hypothetical protein
MQLHSWGRGSTQHVLQGRQAGSVLGGQLWLLLLEDGQGEHIPATHRKLLSQAGSWGPSQRQSKAGELDADRDAGLASDPQVTSTPDV